MKTASFFTYTRPGRISIARWAPRGTPAGFRVFKALAPTREMLSMDIDEYRVLYDDILGRLDPQATWDRLHELAGGHEPVLLCYETPEQIRQRAPGKSFCHRHMVAKWFAESLGFQVPELPMVGCPPYPISHAQKITWAHGHVARRVQTSDPPPQTARRRAPAHPGRAPRDGAPFHTGQVFKPLWRSAHR